MDDVLNRPMLRFGLRWPRLEHRRLRTLAFAAQSMGQSKDDVGLYIKAADSTEAGEPLVVVCQERSEVEQMAALFVACGMARPAIEDLNAGHYA